MKKPQEYLEKCAKWEKDKPNHLSTFEVHLTFDPRGRSSSIKEPKFREIFSSSHVPGIKPLIIGLMNPRGEILRNDYMTASLHKGLKPSEIELPRDVLAEMGFGLIYVPEVRFKVETSPGWLNVQYGDMYHLKPEDEMYFEAHVKLPYAKQRLAEVLELAESAPYVSINTMKMSDELILTIRSHTGSIEDFAAKVDDFAKNFDKSGFSIRAIDEELCIFDSNVHWDRDWTSSGSAS